MCLTRRFLSFVESFFEKSSQPFVKQQDKVSLYRIIFIETQLCYS